MGIVRRKKSIQVPPMNKRMTYKGNPGLLLNIYDSGIAYFKMDGDQTISCDNVENIEIHG